MGPREPLRAVAARVIFLRRDALFALSTVDTKAHGSSIQRGCINGADIINGVFTCISRKIGGLGTIGGTTIARPKQFFTNFIKFTVGTMQTYNITRFTMIQLLFAIQAVKSFRTNTMLIRRCLRLIEMRCAFNKVVNDTEVFGPKSTCSIVLTNQITRGCCIRFRVAGEAGIRIGIVKRRVDGMQGRRRRTTAAAAAAAARAGTRIASKVSC